MAQGGATHIVSQRVQDIQQQLPAQLPNVRQPRHLYRERNTSSPKNSKPFKN